MVQKLLYRVPGMTCEHCTRAVSAEVSAVEGVSEVQVDLAGKLVTVTGEDLDDRALRDAIEEAGYEGA